MLTFSAVIPYSYLKEIGRADNSWGNNSIFTFIQLEKGADIKSVNKKLTEIVVENAPQTNACCNTIYTFDTDSNISHIHV